MDSDGRIDEKADKAIRILALDDAGLKERLRRAYDILCGLQEVPYEGDWANELRDLQAIMTSGDALPDGTISSTVRGLSPEDALDIARRTFNVCLEIRELFKMDNT